MGEPGGSGGFVEGRVFEIQFTPCPGLEMVHWLNLLAVFAPQFC